MGLSYAGSTTSHLLKSYNTIASKFMPKTNIQQFNRKKEGQSYLEMEYCVGPYFINFGENPAKITGSEHTENLEV
jgi:hypothetical protein